MNVEIRKAEETDAAFIAVSILDAVGLPEPSDELQQCTTELCKRDDVLYSWRNTLIAYADGKPAGSITAYEGKHYKEMKTITFELVKQATGNDFTRMEPETLPGEYYLDSLSVRPQFRRHGIGRQLMEAAIGEAMHTDATTTTLACDPANVKARHLYETLGFEHRSDMFIFGENYLKMVKDIENNKA